MFCKECGRNIGEHRICPYCRTLQGSRNTVDFIDIDSGSFNMPAYGTHSMIAAGFLQLFLGAFGIGRFYLGYTKTGILQIISTVLSFGIIGFIWGFCDGIMILNGNEKYDAAGKLLI